jgi:hypothetical protein
MPEEKNSSALSASISLDLDDQWTYLKTHGNPEWQSYPSYLQIVVPRILDFLDRMDIRVTFFIIAQDAAFEKNQDILREIVRRGHDVGNHSFHHDPWLHLYSRSEIEQEIALAEKSIYKTTGSKPIGFRGPGYSFSDNTVRVLADRGYMYDATTLPTFIAPLARAYLLKNSELDRDERKKRKSLFGKFSDGFRSNRPYVMQAGEKALVQMPVTTMPLLKIPFHPSYILYLDLYSSFAAKTYFRLALYLCRLTKTEPSMLLHPLDFLGVDDIDDLSFFPAMKKSSSEKMEVMYWILDELKTHFSLCTLNEYANEWQKLLMNSTDNLETLKVK